MMHFCTSPTDADLLENNYHSHGGVQVSSLDNENTLNVPGKVAVKRGLTGEGFKLQVIYLCRYTSVCATFHPSVLHWGWLGLLFR